MRKRFSGMTFCALALLVILPTSIAAQRPRTRPAAQPTQAPARNDLKITYRTTTSGQSMEATTMLKGSRERSEMKFGQGMEMINVTQCDLKRTIQISDATRKYLITPMDTGDTPASTAAPANTTSEPSRIGGIVTYTTTSVDTGERKEMFGFQARHIKKTLVIDSSPDACNPAKMRMETDGWYIDFAFGLNCETGRQQMGGSSARGGCRDRVRFNQQGAGKTGYALIETTTAYGPDGRVSFTSTREVVDLSREPLDAALFDVPAGYVETQNGQELYGMPSMTSIAPQVSDGGPAKSDRNDGFNAKASGVIRIGVVQINNKSGRPVSTDALLSRLMSEIQSSGAEAVSLNAFSPAEAETAAKLKQCDFILFTDITALKISAAKKLGGMFGRATGVGSGGIDKTEAKVEFKLFAVGEPSPRLQSSATAKEEGDEQSAGTALEQEAKQVSAEARKKSRGK
jgi:hypothetical protein